MKIALCDDVYSDLQHLSTILYRYKEKTNIEMEISTFSSSVDVLSAMQNGANFDLVFFDIIMPDLNGIEAAKILREHNTSTQLIFTTITRDFAIDAFGVKAKDYLLKPINELTVFALLDDIELVNEQKSSLIISLKYGLRKLYIHEIAYCEAFNHTVLWHLSSGAVVESIGTMQKTVEALYPCGDFLQIHRAYLVNLAFISQFHRNDYSVELSSMSKLPIPKAKFAEVVEAYKLYVTQGGTTK